MIEHIKMIIFVITFTVTVLCLLKVLALTLRSDLKFPLTRKRDLDTPLIMYPSIMYQVYWWSVFFGLILEIKSI